MEKCKIDGCAKNQRKKSGYCSMHYSRKLCTGEYGQAEPMRGSWVGKVCIIDGCNEKVKAKGYCVLHYDITRYHDSDPEKIDIMKKSGCAVCGSYERLVVDHDHSCCPENCSCDKCIRGILCNKCNTAAGLLMDNPDRMLALATYILVRKDVLANV